MELRELVYLNVRLDSLLTIAPENAFQAALQPRTTLPTGRAELVSACVHKLTRLNSTLITKPEPVFLYVPEQPIMPLGSPTEILSLGYACQLVLVFSILTLRQEIV